MQFCTPPAIFPSSTLGVNSAEDSVVPSLRHRTLSVQSWGDPEQTGLGEFHSTGSLGVGHTAVTTRCGVQVEMQVEVGV